MRKESHPCFQTTFQNLPNLIIWHFLHPNRTWNTKSAVDSNLNLCCSELIVAQEFLSQSLAKSGLAFHSFRRIKNTRHFWKSTNKHLISFFEVCKSNYFCPRETLFFFFFNLTFYINMSVHLNSPLHEQRTALKQGEQWRRRKLGEKMMELCWIEVREREKMRRRVKEYGQQRGGERRERKSDRWLSKCGAELLEQTWLRVCFCCRWQEE